MDSHRGGSDHPSIDDQQSIKTFIRTFEENGSFIYAEQIFNNRQRTSPVNGILKSEAVYRFLKILEAYGIHYFQDVSKIFGNKDFDAEIQKIPGQKSGISLVYFYMLAGEDNWIKPDRMIIRFLEKIVSRPVNLQEAQLLLVEASVLLKEEYQEMTPRLLDYVVWEYSRALKE
ncbi:hypothetical protein ABC345_19950 [Shouchella sp. 1P09AA]|uniref:hypothetical protein n=1 Tax=unclassified Shouchella TaxID=2893065 RepID=UPI0039A19BD3